MFEYKHNFVICVSFRFLKKVNEFRKIKYVDKEIVKYTKQRISNSHVHTKGDYEFDLRCVSIRLSNGKEEILIIPKH